jgi:hypothetical protein
MPEDDLLDEATATFLYQVIDEYRDGGYVPIGYGYDAAHIIERCDAEVVSIVDDETVDSLIWISAPICLVVLEAHRHDEIVALVKFVRRRSDDVYVRWFPIREVTQ